ncbi:MAG: hypothetical protein EA356_13435 [Geminicoccaceae bacterium]|nr:MAG: hypothetical protein EA356_13435 [Geminicoccaceae bacterium]
MAQDDVQPARTDERAAPPPPAAPAPVRTSRTKGFVAGVVGGVVGALGSVYALQFPEVRQNLPLPEQAALIVNPEAVARIVALEQELAQVRNFAREADTRGAVQSLSARMETLSGEVTAAATSAQLNELRSELSSLAMPEGAAELEARLGQLQAGLTELGETAARASALATVESAVQGFERRVGELETTAPALRSDIDQVASDLAAARERAAEIAATLALAEMALAERTAALGGRIDATARDVAEVQGGIGAASARIQDLAGQVQSLASQAAAATTAAADAGVAAASTRDVVSGFVATVEDQMAGVLATLATVEGEAARAVERAAGAEASVAVAMQRARVAGQLSAAARSLDQAVAAGEDLTPARRELAAIDLAPLDAAQAQRLAGIDAVIADHEAGVASLPALRASLANLRPAVEAAVSPPAPEGSVGAILGTLQLRPTVRDGDAAAALDRMRQLLDADDVAGAVAQAETLPEAGRAALADWITAARDHLAVDRARQALLDLGRDVTATAAGAS